ncbi:MAG: hypothetical protein LBM38_02110 [Clostridiales bacterium]|jgi:hypothetical protein|nr:hypothetical protein [Clostridiales bacterium]
MELFNTNEPSEREVLDDFISRGKKIVIPQQRLSWEGQVNKIEALATDSDRRIEKRLLKGALEVMEALSNNDSFEQVNRMLPMHNFMQNSEAHHFTLKIIGSFHPRGLDYAKWHVNQTGDHNLMNNKLLLDFFKDTQKRNSEYTKLDKPDILKWRANFIIFPQLADEWNKRVDLILDFFNNPETAPIALPLALMQSSNIKASLEVMESLSSGTPINEVLKESQKFKSSPEFFAFLMDTVVNFHPRGVEFLEAVMAYDRIPIDKEFGEHLNEIKARNLGYQKGLAQQIVDFADSFLSGGPSSNDATTQKPKPPSKNIGPSL